MDVSANNFVIMPANLISDRAKLKSTKLTNQDILGMIKNNTSEQDSVELQKNITPKSNYQKYKFVILPVIVAATLGSVVHISRGRHPEFPFLGK